MIFLRYVGDSEKNVDRYFQMANKSQPCAIFIDEVDSICLKR